jgi:hypothetical protein
MLLLQPNELEQYYIQKMISGVIITISVYVESGDMANKLAVDMFGRNFTVTPTLKTGQGGPEYD